MSEIWPLLAIAVMIAIGWRLGESWRDRRLFTADPGGFIENIHPAQASALLGSATGAQVLDVRSPGEFAAGSLPGAVNIPIHDPDFQTRLAAMDRQRPILVYCAGGFRSRRAIPALKAGGFRSIHHLHRGYLSWKQAGLPVDHPGGSGKGR